MKMMEIHSWGPLPVKVKALKQNSTTAFVLFKYSLYTSYVVVHNLFYECKLHILLFFSEIDERVKVNGAFFMHEVGVI